MLNEILVKPGGRKHRPEFAEKSLFLNEDQIHLWEINLEVSVSEIGKLIKVLSKDEKQRAERFHFTKDRRRFIAARAALRRILGHYLGIAPQAVEFGQNGFGKPLLIAPDDQIRFNLSHSNETALVAVAKKREIGVDLEFMRDDFEILKTAASVFSSEELKWLEKTSPTRQNAAFFCGWTRKEAYIKAVGAGFSYPVKSLTVSLDPEVSEFSLRTNDFPDAADWMVRSWKIGDEFMAAVAVEGKNKKMVFRRFDFNGNREEVF